MNKYKTNSLSLASALSLFLSITSIEKDPINNNCLFCFDDTPQLRQLISDFWNKNLQVDASDFFSQTKTLKARIHETL